MADDDVARERRRRLHTAIETAVADHADDRDESRVVTGWLLIVETVTAEGERILSTSSADATGESLLPPWTAEGWAAHAVRYDLFESTSDDSDEGP